jgi:predicted ATP-grasp superfamily ATP-dependent carboligase
MKQAIIPSEEVIALAIVRSLGKKNIATTIISENKYGTALYSKYCNKRIISENSLDILSKFTENDIIMPISEEKNIELAKNKNKYNCNFAFPEYSILAFASDKNKVLKRAHELKIPYPDTIFVEDIDLNSYKLDKIIDQIRYPAVIKPLKGGGGKGITFVNSKDQLQQIYCESVKKFGPVLIQEKIPYKERYSVAILMNFEHNVRRHCVLKVIRCYPIGSGPAAFVMSVDRPDLVKLSERLLESIGYYGIAEIEFVIDERDNMPKLMEINPRFWRSLQGAISAGVDFPHLLYKLFQEGDIDKKNNYKIGIKTRNVIFKDFNRLFTILKGHYPMQYKKSSLFEFLKFYQDDAYFVFDIHDIKPFLPWFVGPILRRYQKITHRSTDFNTLIQKKDVI